MLSIRFKPVGKKKQISFRVVVVERRSKLQGRFIEDLGWCNTHTDTHSVKEERIKYWLGVGAQPTDSVHNMLVRASVVDGPKRAVHAKKKVSKEEAQVPAESQNESTKQDMKSQSVEKAEEAKSSTKADDRPTHLSSDSHEFREKEESTEEALKSSGTSDESESQPQESVEEESKQEKTQEGKEEEK